MSSSQASVLIVGNFLSAHIGNRCVCEELAPRLRALGHPVITTSDRKSRAARLVDMLRVCWTERGNYELAQVDVYSGPAFLWAEAVCYLLRNLNKPYILTLHGGELPRFARSSPERVRRLLQSADLVTAPSRYLQQELQWLHSGIQVLPNAIEIDRYPFRERTIAQPKLIWLRAFHSIYNPGLAVRTLQLLTDVYPAAHLTMAGPDKHDGSLPDTRALTARLGLEQRVRFPGQIAKSGIGRFVNEGDIFLNTTNIDNMPVSVLEAMTCGACVVSTNVGGLRYLLEDGKNALLVPPDDPCAMAGAVRRILADRVLSARLSNGARQKAASMDWSVVLEQWELAFAQVLRNRGRHTGVVLHSPLSN